MCIQNMLCKLIFSVFNNNLNDICSITHAYNLLNHVISKIRINHEMFEYNLQPINYAHVVLNYYIIFSIFGERSTTYNKLKKHNN